MAVRLNGMEYIIVIIIHLRSGLGEAICKTTIKCCHFDNPFNLILTPHRKGKAFRSSFEPLTMNHLGDHNNGLPKYLVCKTHFRKRKLICLQFGSRPLGTLLGSLVPATPVTNTHCIAFCVFVFAPLPHRRG